MNRKLMVYGVIFGLVVLLIIIIDASRPKPVNWTPTYGVKDKIPLGLYVLSEEMPKLFGGQDLEKFSMTPYEFFDEQYDYDNNSYNVHGCFISISEENRLDRESVKELVYFAEHGNTVFLSMGEFPEHLLDTLNLSMKAPFLYRDSLEVKLNRKAKESYWFNEGANFNYFDSIQKAKATVLGEQDENHPNFIRVPFGKGSFLLHSQPAAFSNFYLLKGNHYRYTANVLSYIPKDNVYWFTGGGRNNELSDNPLRYILANKGLKWAMWMGLLGFLVFVIFNAKRKQRIVNEIPPVRNTTVDFAKTIGNLYYQEGNHHTIIEKKIIYFLEYIRNEYMIDTYSLDDAFVDRLAHKSGRPVEDIEYAVKLIKKHRHQFESTEADVIEINKAIEKLRL
jgi:hypothetical protein